MELKIDQALEKAAEALKQKRPQNAERLYRAVLSINPKHPEANHNLGVSMILLGKPQAALPYLKIALETSPSRGQFWISYVSGLIAALHLEDAEKVLRIAQSRGLPNQSIKYLEEKLARQIQERDQDYQTEFASASVQKYAPQGNQGGLKKVESTRNWQVKQEQKKLLASYDAGNFRLAEQQARSFIDTYRSHPFGWKLLGAVYIATGQREEALVATEQFLKLAPNDPAAHSNLAVILQSLGRLQEAEIRYREAIRLNPRFTGAYSNLGNALQELGRLHEAKECYLEAIRLKPSYADVHNNLGSVLKELNMPSEAEASFRRAIRLKPTLVEAYSNLGGLLQDLGRLSEAEACLQEGIFHKPTYAEAHNNLGNLFRDRGCPAKAITSYKEAIRLQPEYQEANSNLLFTVNSTECFPIEITVSQSKHYGEQVSSNARPKFKEWLRSSEQRRIRLGFVSGDLRNHPIGYFIEGLLKHLDRSKLEIIIFSATHKQDALTERIKSHVDQWTSIYGSTDQAAASLIYKQQIDILFDLSGHTAFNRIGVFSYKPSPIQVSWLGYFATTGLPEMDYLLGDPWVTPESENSHFTEKILRMPQTYLCFTPPDFNVPVGPLPAVANHHITFGCFNNLTKITLNVVKLWSDILRRIDGAKLFLKSRQLDEPSERVKIAKQFANFNIANDRLILEGSSSRQELLSTYNQVDIALDTFPYPGGTTSVEALWMGVPVLTIKGNRFLSHVGETIAHNSGNSIWIAENLDDYAQKAVRYAVELDQLNNFRQRMRRQLLESAICDAQRFARNFEQILEKIFEFRRK